MPNALIEMMKILSNVAKPATICNVTTNKCVNPPPTGKEFVSAKTDFRQ